MPHTVLLWCWCGGGNKQSWTASKTRDTKATLCSLVVCVLSLVCRAFYAAVLSFQAPLLVAAVVITIVAMGLQR